MGYRVTGLSAAPFKSFYGMTETGLAALGVRRVVVDAEPGYPDRIELRDGRLGETMLLLNHVSLDVDTPYRATHAIYVREGAEQTAEHVNELPAVMRIRLLSLRGFDASGMMRDADVVAGAEAEAAIERLFQDDRIAYIHAHNAKQGCFSCRIDRTE